MAGEMRAQATLTQGVSFAVTTGSGHRIVLDGARDAGGQDEGPRPMEMLLTALAGCAGIGIIGILRKMHQDVSGYEIRVHGERSEELPRVFTEITIEHILTGRQLEPAAVKRAIALDEERYCGVNAMLGQSARITQTFQIREEGLAHDEA
jgi:putative redox protein